MSFVYICEKVVDRKQYTDDILDFCLEYYNYEICNQIRINGGSSNWEPQ